MSLFRNTKRKMALSHHLIKFQRILYRIDSLLQAFSHTYDSSFVSSFQETFRFSWRLIFTMTCFVSYHSYYCTYEYIRVRYLDSIFSEIQPLTLLQSIFPIFLANNNALIRAISRFAYFPIYPSILLTIYFDTFTKRDVFQNMKYT